MLNKVRLMSYLPQTQYQQQFIQKKVLKEMPRSFNNYQSEKEQFRPSNCSIFCSQPEPHKIVSFELANKKLSRNKSQKGIKLQLHNDKIKETLTRRHSQKTLQRPKEKYALKNIFCPNNKNISTNIKEIKQKIVNYPQEAPIYTKRILLQPYIQQKSNSRPSDIKENAKLLSPFYTTNHSTMRLITIDEISQSNKYGESNSNSECCKGKCSIPSLFIQEHDGMFHYLDFEGRLSKMKCHKEANSRIIIQEPSDYLKESKKVRQLCQSARQTETVISQSQASNKKSEDSEFSQVVSFSRSQFNGPMINS